MIKAIIIDDEKLAREGIRQLLNANPRSFSILAEANTAHAAIQQIEKHVPELIFLDIQLPDMSGLEMLDHLSYQPKIIFTTAYQKYAIEAFEKMSIDYLVKPITQDRFDKAIEKFEKFGGNENKSDYNSIVRLLKNSHKKPIRSSLPIKKENKILLIDFDEITHLKAEDKYVNVCIESGKSFLTEKSLTELEDKLSEQFMRVHRSYIVNLDKIFEIEKYFKGTLILTLDDKQKTKLKTGETYSRKVKEKLGLF